MKALHLPGHAARVLSPTRRVETQPGTPPESTGPPGPRDVDTL